MGERKTLYVDRDTQWLCFPGYQATKSSSLTRKHVGKIEDQTQADPLGFLLRALVSIQLQSPRSQKPQQPLPSTKDCARHADAQRLPYSRAAGSQPPRPCHMATIR